MSLLPPVSERRVPGYPSWPRTPSDDAREAFALFDEDLHSEGGLLAMQAAKFEPTNDLAVCAWAIAASLGMVGVPRGGDFIDAIVEPARACVTAMAAGPAPASLVGLFALQRAAPLPCDGGLDVVLDRLGGDERDGVIRRMWTDPAAFLEAGIELAPDWPYVWITALIKRSQGHAVLEQFTSAELRERVLAGCDRDDHGDPAQRGFGEWVSFANWSASRLSSWMTELTDNR